MTGSTRVALGILASRVFGFVRQAAIARFFGTSFLGDVFTFANRFPNVLQNLLGEGTLSASFIPVYADLLQRGEKEEAGRVAGAVLALLFALAGLAALVGIALAPAIVAVFLPNAQGEGRALAVATVRWVFPTVGVLVLSAWALGIQNAHRRFLLSYLAPVASSVAVVAALFVFGWWLGWTGGSLLMAAAAGTLVGAVLQLAVQLPAVWRLEPQLRMRWDLARPGVREVVDKATTVVGGRGVVQLSAWLDQWLAGLLASGAIAALGNAQTLYMLPISVFAISVVAAELPELARERSDVSGALRSRTNAAFERVLFYVAPSAAAFVFLPESIVGAVFEGGAFTRDSTVLVSWILRMYGLGLIATATSRITASAFYALGEPRTPARVATVRVAVSAIAAVAGMLLFEPVFGLPSGPLAHVRIGALALGGVGLAAGTTLAAWVEWVLLRQALGVRVGPVGPRAGVAARIAGCCVLATCVGVGTAWAIGDLPPLPAGLAACAAFGVVYLASAAAANLDEAAALARRIRRR